VSANIYRPGGRDGRRPSRGDQRQPASTGGRTDGAPAAARRAGPAAARRAGLAAAWSAGGTGGASQQWQVNANGTITGVQSGLCLDVTGVSTSNGALVRLWTCDG
jgi:Ricin-type beta-trefoil lectin domain